MNHAEIDALAQLLEGGPTDGEAASEARALAALAHSLESAAAPLPRAEFKADLRSQLVEAARTQAAAPSFLTRLRDSFHDSTARIRYSARMAAATGATAMALSSGGVALAAQRSLPTDPFYGAKLAFEDARLAFVSDAVERGRLLLSYADRRMAEAEASASSGNMAGVQRALMEADHSSREGATHIIRAAQERGDPAVLDVLSEFSRQQRSRLEALLPLLSGDARLAAEDALVVLGRIDQRVAVLGGSCGQCDSDAAAGGADGGGAQAGGDFDLTRIPPADEPFAACPCVDDSAASPVVDEATDAPKRARRKTGGQNNGGETNTGSGRQPAPAAGEEPGDGGSGTVPRAPKTGNETVDDAVDDVVDDVEDVIDDVLEDVPVSPPTRLPVPTPSLNVDDILP